MQPIRGLVVGVMITSGACTPLDDAEEQELYELELRTAGIGGEIVPPSTNTHGDGGGRTGGDWIGNGLSDPTVSGVDPGYPLNSTQGLGMGGWLGEGEIAGEDLIHYMVECALDEGQSVIVSDGVTSFTFQGLLGLAPEWETQACDQDCQQWVSACLFARTNASGAEVDIFVQSDHPMMGFGLDPAFPHYEATFFGNAFDDPAAMHACVGSGTGLLEAEAQGRTCALDPEECGFTVHEDCVVAAGCGVSVTGVATIDCQPDPAGPVYSGISVHVQDL